MDPPQWQHGQEGCVSSLAKQLDAISCCTNQLFASSKHTKAVVPTSCGTFCVMVSVQVLLLAAGFSCGA